MIALFVTMISVLSLAPAAHAANLVNIDIQPTVVSNVGGTPDVMVGTAAGGFPGSPTDAWNKFDVGAGYPTPPPTFNSNLTVNNLLKADGATNSGISFSLLANGNPATSSWSGYSVNSAEDLRDDGLNLFTSGTETTSNSIFWQLSGLVPGNSYDLKMFGWSSNTYIGTWAVTNPILSLDPALQTTGSIATFTTVVADGGGLISGSFAKPVNALQNQTFWTGMQIQFEAVEANGVPEPSTFVLAALGLVGLSFVVWRKKYRWA